MAERLSLGMNSRCYSPKLAHPPPVGRFVSGMWWEPSPGCVREMLEFAGFDEIAWEPPSFSQRAIFSARKITERQMTFKRGLNYPFADILDARQRIFDRLRPEDEPRTSD